MKPYSIQDHENDSVGHRYFVPPAFHPIVKEVNKRTQEAERMCCCADTSVHHQLAGDSESYCEWVLDHLLLRGAVSPLLLWGAVVCLH